MSRPAQLSGPIVMVEVDGAIATWSSGEFAGDPDVVEAARVAALAGFVLEVAGQRWRAGSHDARSATAALHAFLPWRTRILEAPDSVTSALVPREEELSQRPGTPATPGTPTPPDWATPGLF